MSSPSNRIFPVIVPRATSCIRLRHRRSVDLPQPDGPIIARTRFDGTSREMFFSAWVFPKYALTFIATIFAKPELFGCGVSVGRGFSLVLNACSIDYRSEYLLRVTRRNIKLRMKIRKIRTSAAPQACLFQSSKGALA